MNKLFHIENENSNQQGNTLLCEIGDTYACTAVCEPERKAVDNLSYYTFLPQQMLESVRQIIALHKDKTAFSKVIVCSGFSESVLVPYKYFNAENAHLFFIDTTNQELLHDTIAEWQLVNAYILPKAICSLFENGSVQYIHSYTQTLKMYNGFVSEYQLSINFSPQQFRVMVKKEGQLLLAQTYSYSVPLDVVYYLLSIYQQFELPKTDTYIILSGLIEEDSALYKELNNYFLNLHFDTSSAFTVEADYPPHYFTSIHNLAACAL